MWGRISVLAELGSAGSSSTQDASLRPDQDVRCQVLDWYARKHSRVVRSTYAAELLSLLDAVGQGNMVATAMDEIHSGVETATQLLARHAGRQRSIEHDACVDAKAVFDGITAQCPRTPADKPLFLHAPAMREYLEAGWVDRLWWIGTLAMLADGMTKGSIDREALIMVCQQGLWKVTGAAPQCKRLRDAGEHQ